MELAQTFLLAALISLVGFLLPGMINMTIVKVALEQSRKNALKFTFGSICIIGVHVSIAVFFSQYLSENPQLLKYITYIGVAVFLILSIVFYMQARTNKTYGGLTNGTFLAGVKMTTMNMLAIPFFLAFSTGMQASGYVKNQMPDNAFFVMGAIFGSFAIFLVYMFLADYIQRRAVFIARNINYILSGLFLLLAVTTIIKTISQ